ncbi:hypothetical protein, partial [Campylobacter helveticus]
KNSNFSFKQENSNAQEEKANCSKLFNCKELNHFKNNSSKNEISQEHNKQNSIAFKNEIQKEQK